MKRIPGLDGLRGISILLVLAGHLAGTRYCYSIPFIHHLGDIQNLGVRVFFVISGYLITLLLLEEQRKSGSISLEKFYIRRTLRIFPAFYAFILVVSALSALGFVALKSGDLLHAFTYTMNYHPVRSWWVGHLWSLSVEEQFYLLWPATLLLLGIRRGLHAATAVIFLSPIIRLGVFWYWPSDQLTIGETFPTIADTIATGCVLAGYKESLLAQSWFQEIMHSKWFLAIPLFTIALNIKGGGRLRCAILDTIINVCIAMCVCRATLYKEDRAGRLLNSKALVFLGVLSYSLYLWQQIFVNHESQAWIASFPLNLFLAFGAAMLCHYCIEKPFLALRNRKREEPARAPAIPVLRVGSEPDH
jgi:peptidoglycan/LPS O-acetylase OafA/YrhL